MTSTTGSGRVRPPKGERWPCVYASSHAIEQWRRLFPHGRPLENVVAEAIVGDGRVFLRGTPGEGVVETEEFTAAVSRQPSLHNRTRNVWMVIAVRGPSGKQMTKQTRRN
jgi:hypothetical protein